MQSPSDLYAQIFRVYFDENEIGSDGYPYAWHRLEYPAPFVRVGDPNARLGIKDIVRMNAGYRCIRCGHPYTGGGEWSPCDHRCTHRGEARVRESTAPPDDPWKVISLDRNPWALTEVWTNGGYTAPVGKKIVYDIEARWRILTVHHLNGIKYDCRWWNLVSLCQRCHLTIQAKVYLERPWNKPHSEWFKPYAAGWYASNYLGEELSREQVMARLDELLALELTQHQLPGF